MVLRKTRWIFVIILLFLLVPVGGYRDFPIAKSRYQKYSPAIHGDIIIWEDKRNSTYDIYGFNLTTEEEPAALGGSLR